MPTLDHLPTAEEGVAGLMQLVDVFGVEETFVFLGYIRAGDARPANDVRARLAAQLVEDEMRHTPDYDEARRAVADRLGYTGTTRVNFYKLAKHTTREGHKIPITSPE